ncbi:MULTISPECIES: hypothetical protein [Microseira]|jgi:hypothetical protein|uniref:Uncharacterized protein n=1 Tax=Microseira wollei NIES-4236 TaxID=2530354 RepID=A0AAV3X1U0_9CYAN|nr:hypothetical protein [Microseira wollei]GET35898.1 hypothetical protein MiSe_06460 [Microseira wollei NIES-4236]
MTESLIERYQRTIFRIVLHSPSPENGETKSIKTRKWEEALRIYAHGVALDAEERIVVLIQAHGQKLRPLFITEYVGYFKAARGVIPFMILLDKEDILIFAWYSDNVAEPICTLKVIDVLSRYAPDIESKQKSRSSLSASYLVGMTKSWIDDLVYHWKSETPPALELIEAIGLLPLLKDGSTQSDVEIRLDILH